MSKEKAPANIWLVEHPTDQYNEDVKDLARKNGLVIFDAKQKANLNSDFFAQDVPKLTKKKSEKSEKKA